MTQTNFAANIENLTNFFTKETEKLIEKTTISTGKTLEQIAENPFLRSANKVIGLDWLMSFLGQADLAKVQANVTQVKSQYPHETANQIAHRLIVQKAWKGGQLGLITNIIPPIAVFFLGIEVIATTKLQTEMVYEIAAAYGLNLKEPARRGEALAIFGLSLGADVLKTGLSIVEIIPGVGAVVGASTNAAMLYVLGQTACRFYERKANNLATTSMQQETDRDWQTTLNQSQILDQILAQMLKISYPNRDWKEILPIIREISPSSVETIALYWDRPQNLSTLLEQLLPEFAPLALNRCSEIAKSNGGEITSAEQEVLSQIVLKFNLVSLI
jgi:uncharacterized protein (DUF697 family)